MAFDRGDLIVQGFWGSGVDDLVGCLVVEFVDAFDGSFGEVAADCVDFPVGVAGVPGFAPRCRDRGDRAWRSCWLAEPFAGGLTAGAEHGCDYLALCR